MPSVVPVEKQSPIMAAAVDRGSAPPSSLPPNPPDHAPPSFDFAFSDFLKREYRFGLDPNRPLCKAFREGHCPLGKDCPDKHQVNHPFNSLVCKHWLRGLCKKGDQCEFLHEYNLRRMPECNQFARTLYCSNGDECLYLHIDPASKLAPCPHYEKGFCPLGPRCAKKHIRKTLCRVLPRGVLPVWAAVQGRGASAVSDGFAETGGEGGEERGGVGG
ncbi:RNA-binding component of cleavage and polyadenylation factor [Xanthoria parietina]